jgi:hypothetical protein
LSQRLAWGSLIEFQRQERSMKKHGSSGMNGPAAGSTKAPDWKSKDYGLGPEPPRYSPEWEEWVESRALLAGLEEAKKAPKAG